MRERRELPEDLSKLPRSELVELYTTLNNEAADVNAQLERAQRKHASTGVYADRDWYERANLALLTKRRIIRKIQAEFKRRKDASGPTRGSHYVESLPLSSSDADIEDYISSAHPNASLRAFVAMPDRLVFIWNGYAPHPVAETSE